MAFWDLLAWHKPCNIEMNYKAWQVSAAELLIPDNSHLSCKVCFYPQVICGLNKILMWSEHGEKEIE